MALVGPYGPAQKPDSTFYNLYNPISYVSPETTARQADLLKDNPYFNLQPFDIFSKNPLADRPSGNDVTLDPASPTDQPNNPQAQTAPAAAQGLPPEVIDYLYADLAKYYGMSKETAYQEALANTSYQRAMKDMKAAGLNPAAIFGSGKASGADGVSYVSSAAPAGSGGSTARSSSKNKENLFSSGAYYGLSAGIGLLAGILTKSPTGYWIGSSATQGLLGAMNAGYQSRK